MKKIILLATALAVVMISAAQGIYQLWGTTTAGGAANSGVIFHTNAAGNNFRLNHQFDLNSNGISPFGALLQYNGKFYGIAQNGGSNNTGVIFEWDPGTNVYTKKIDFSSANGSSPCASLSLFDGKLYGMTSSGGTSDLGVIFEWDPVTNIYTKKIDFSTPVGSNPSANAGLSLKDGKFYGMTTLGGSIGDGVIFEWDPVTNVYTKKIDFSNDFNFNGAQPAASLTLYGSKFYGLTTANGIHGGGVIFEWDPATNIYTKKFDFLDNGQFGAGPQTNLILSENKFYGITGLGGTSNFGVIFEWDPLTNVYTVKINLDGSNGSNPQRSLTLSGSRFYGMTGLGGTNNLGVIFEWDSVTNLYLKKKDFDGTDGAKPFSSSLTLAQAPVANGLGGSCVSFPAVTIDNSNNNVWVPIVDDEGNAVAEIKANGNNLGTVNASMYINNGAVREDANKTLYLDRNITIIPQVQPSSPVDIRLYIKGTEFVALKNAVNSAGQPSGVTSINDVGIYKNDDICSATASLINNPVATAAGAWQADYVLSASISSFSSFYFAKARGCQGPLIQCRADTVVDATAFRCGAVVWYKRPVITDTCEKVTLKQIAGLHSGAFFPVGATVNTFVATTPSGKKDTCSFTVTVKDKKPPFITPVSTYPTVLWPPDHKLRNVSVNYFAWDNCGPASCALGVTSNEPVTGTGYGDRAPDWIVLDKHHVQLRAERSKSGDGRVYTITVTCSDASGNISTQKTRVVVPDNIRGHHSKDPYSDEENDGDSYSKGAYSDQLFDCKVSPNPGKQHFNLEIKSASGEKIEVSVFDLNGKLVSKPGIVKNNTLQFGDNLLPGVYMVEVKQGRQRKLIKVIKE